MGRSNRLVNKDLQAQKVKTKKTNLAVAFEAQHFDSFFFFILVTFAFALCVCVSLHLSVLLVNLV